MAFERFFGSDESDTSEEPESPPPLESLFGEPYDITPNDVSTVGEWETAVETETEGVVAGADVRQMFESAGQSAPGPLWLGYGADNHRGFREAPLLFDAQFRHLWVTGTTGYGKSTELLNLMIQWAYAGYGFVFADPKAADSRQLLRMLPEHRLDDVVWIEPGATDHEKTVGLNFLELPECATQAERANEIENRIENLKAIFDTDEYWGVNMESITESMARAMLQSDTDFSVIDMYFTLLNADRREEFALDVEDPYVREFCLEIAAMDDETIRPLLKRIKTWVENAVIRKIIAHRESTIDFQDIIQNDRIVIVSTPVENSDIKKLVTLGVLRNLWSAIQQRANEQEGEPDPYFVVCDEFDEIASENLDIESMLARARSMRLSVTLASQYPSQLEESTRKAMLNNCDTLLSFSVNDVDDARLLMKRFPGYTAEDLIATDQYQAWTKIPMEGGRYSDPVLLNTFPQYPPLRSADAVEDVIASSLDRYGTEPLTDAEIMQDLVYGEANTVATPTRQLAEYMAEAIRAVQLREGCRETNGWVDVTVVDEELARRVDLVEEDVPAFETADLPDVRDSSRLIETDFDLESDAVRARLTDAGESEAQPETGDVRAAGGSAHDSLLEDAEEVLTDQGFSVRIVEQDGTSQPDGLAVHPDFDATFTIEAETTTPRRPAKVLENLARARATDRIPVFFVRPDDDSSKWARRIEAICSPPIRDRSEDGVRFYTCDELLAFGGGAATTGGVTGVRPRRSSSNTTVWARENGELVLTDGETEFTRVPADGELSKDDVPAYYSFDRESSQYTVYARGEVQKFDSREAFDAEWVPIRRPFRPSGAFPDGDVSRDSYLVVILAKAGEPQLYQAGSTTSLASSISDRELWPAGSESCRSTKSVAGGAGGGQPALESAPGGDSPGHDSEELSDIDGNSVEVFASLYVQEDGGSRVTHQTLFDAYRAWLSGQDLEGTTDRVWFARKLGQVVEFETERSRVDGERVQTYVGLSLTPEGQSLLPEGES